MHIKTNRHLQAKIQLRRARKGHIPANGAVRGYLAIVAIVSLLFTLIPDALFASTFGPTVLASTEAFSIIDDRDTASNVVLKFGDTLQEQLIYDRSGQRFKFTRGLFIAGNTTITGSLLVNIGNSTATADTALETIGTISGTTLNANGLLTGSTLQGFGLYSCNGAANKVTYNAGTKKFLCESDQAGGGGGGLVDHYVRASGDTMTGGLLLQNGGAPGTIDNGVLLETQGLMSGHALRVSGNTNIHGGIAASGSVRADGDLTLNDDLTVADTVLTFGNSVASQTLKFLSTLQKFQFSKSVSVVGNLSGSSLTIDGNASFTGGVIARGGIATKGTLSGQTLTVMNNSTSYLLGNVAVGKTSVNTGIKFDVNGALSGSALRGAGLTDCDTAGTSKLMWDTTTGKFSCGTDQTGGGGGGATASGMNITIIDGIDTSAAATNLAANTLNCVSDPSLRVMANFGDVTRLRWMGKIGGTLDTTGTNCGDRTCIRLQYHTGGNPAVATGDAGWTTLDNSAGGHTASTWFYDPESSIPAGARINHLLVRACLFGGDGAADPTITGVHLNAYP